MGDKGMKGDKGAQGSPDSQLKYYSLAMRS